MGTGYFGETRQCKSLKNTNMIRAVKILIKTNMGPENCLIYQRFNHELEIMKDLDHPNILKIIECYD